ncbi:hypothetical protein TNCV_2907891 [Trichonephila clavipes]|nr:hypothetical protein TNCV_2907891 [Trichonephila clavipes]
MLQRLAMDARPTTLDSAYAAVEKILLLMVYKMERHLAIIAVAPCLEAVRVTILPYRAPRRENSQTGKSRFSICLTKLHGVRCGFESQSVASTSFISYIIRHHPVTMPRLVPMFTSGMAFADTRYQHAAMRAEPRFSSSRFHGQYQVTGRDRVIHLPAVLLAYKHAVEA